MAGKWQRIQYMPGTGIGEGGQRVTAGREHIALARRAAGEGMVLLKNARGALPLKKGTRLAVFGKAQADYVQGGGGSGEVYGPYRVSLLQALEEADRAGEISLVHPVSGYYRTYVNQCYQEGGQPGKLREPALPDELLKEARAETEDAVITICRFSGEGWERTGVRGDGDFYLSDEESAMVDAVTAAFPHVYVVLNTGGMMDTAWMRERENVVSVLLAWQGGMEGGHAACDILLGKTVPSGHLTDTFAENFDAYPSSADFSVSDDFVEYTEDIYVGYRYFETVPGAAGKVIYPFGYGLSYTDFSLDSLCFLPGDGQYDLVCRVNNTGRYAGREVVQVYVHCPSSEMERPERILVGFAKTGEIPRGGECTAAVHFTDRELACYSEARHAWLLEGGEYTVYVGSNVRDVTEAARFTVPETKVLESVENRCRPHKLSRRIRRDGSYEALPVDDLLAPPDHLAKEAMPDGGAPLERTWVAEGSLWHGSPEHRLQEVAEGKLTLDAFMEQLSDEQMIHLLGGQPNRGCANTFGFGNLPKYGIPNVMTADGPAGLRITPDCGVPTTAFPCATLLACSWDMDLLEAVGHAAAEEVHENGFGVWLAPALNIHRNPLCGRNFEYYSEDPLVSGRCAAAMVRGIQRVGVAATIKHFACNNKETNRRDSDSRVSERALREIYLRAFEICVREADPWALMSSYNIVNGIRASENADLLTGILRDEWGFGGVVTTDWYTYGGQYLEISAGNDIKMGRGMPEDTLRRLERGEIDPQAIRQSARRVLELILRLK